MIYLFLFLSVFVLVLRYFVIPKYLAKSYNEDSYQLYPLTTSPSLSTFNGIGFLFVGSFRNTKPSNEMIMRLHTTEEIYVTYHFFCVFFLPIIPLGAYLVQQTESGGSLGGYSIFGKVPMSFIEVLICYLTWYTWVILAILLLILFFSLI